MALAFHQEKIHLKNVLTTGLQLKDAWSIGQDWAWSISRIIPSNIKGSLVYDEERLYDFTEIAKETIILCGKKLR